jgi:transmembrane sensor
MSSQPDLRKDAKQVDARAAAWLDRRDRGAWAEDDQASLDAWLQEDPIHRIAYWRIDAAWARTERLAALRSGEIESTQTRRINRLFPSIFRTVAVLVVGVLAAAAWSIFGADRADQTFKTALGERETVNLADGTQIELNTDTILRARVTPGERKVWLDKGEAFFQIKHDASHPFVVVTKTGRLTDLGTKFVVRSDAKRLIVAVVDGRVRLDMTSDRSKSFVLKRDDVASASAGAVDLSKVSDRNLDNAVAWRNGVLVFDHTPLAEVAEDLNRYNAVKIVIADAHIGHLAIDGAFSTKDVDAVANVAQDIFGLRVERRGQEVVISR